MRFAAKNYAISLVSLGLLGSYLSTPPRRQAVHHWLDHQIKKAVIGYLTKSETHNVIATFSNGDGCYILFQDGQRKSDEINIYDTKNRVKTGSLSEVLMRRRQSDRLYRVLGGESQEFPENAEGVCELGSKRLEQAGAATQMKLSIYDFNSKSTSQPDRRVVAIQKFP